MKFVDDFVAYAQEFTGCPRPFLEWSAILCLSVVAGRKHVLRRGDWDVHPNLWIMLLGNSSSYKSTGLAIARRLLREAVPEVLLGQEYSSEKLLDDLSVNSHRLFTYDEAETFFKMLGQKYNPTLKSALMTLWRDDWYVRKTKQGEVIIKDAYLCWAGASTPVQIAQQINGHDTDLLSGMLPRFTIVPYFGEEHSISNPPPSDKIKKATLVQRLKELAIQGEREYAYQNGTLEKMEDWQKRFDKRLHEQDPMLGAFFRKMRDEHFHKLAMIAAFERGSVHIESADLLEVIPRLWEIESKLPLALQRLTETKFGRDRDRILGFIKKNGVVTRSEILVKFPGINGHYLTDLITSFVLDDLIKSEITKTGGRPSQKLTYFGA
jgi:hypothetical protein